MNAGKTKVILVGNSIFPKWGGETKDIPNVDQNIDLLKKIFIDADYFGIPNDGKHLIEIKDETSQEILLRVKHETKSFAERAQYERLIFYYSGHGIPGEDHKLFFASKDTVRSDYEITAVDSGRLYSYLKGFGAKELIVILDCCYAAQSKENLGDADTLIANSLPEQKEKWDEAEIGAYYLFAAGKDNVAKFNPKEPKKPTYFTEALLTSIKTGTKPGIGFITIGEIYIQLRQEIDRLKNIENADIPDPRPFLEGEVNGFIFCKNVKFANQEDMDWAEVCIDPDLKKIEIFEDKYQQTRFEAEKDEMRSRLIEGLELIKKMRNTKDIKLAGKIKTDYMDLPSIKKKANDFMRELARAVDDENKTENGSPLNVLSKDAEMKATDTPDKANENPDEKASSSPQTKTLHLPEIEQAIQSAPEFFRPENSKIARPS